MCTQRTEEKKSPLLCHFHAKVVKNAFLLAKTPGGLVRNSSDVEDIYEDIHIQDFTSPRIITSPISLPTSPTSPLIEFRTSPYYYSELISKNPTYNINNIKTSTLTPYKKTSHYRTKPSSQTLKNVNFRSYVPKVASEQLNELHKRFAASDNRDTTVRKIEEQYSVVNKRNKENVQHCADANGNIQSDNTANINKLFVDGRIKSLESPVLTDNSHDSDDIPPEKPPLVRNGHLININNKTSFCKNFTYQETSDEENNTQDKQATSPISPCDNIKLFEKPSFQNFGPPKLNRPNSLSFKSNNEFETFHGNKLNKINVCNNKPPLQPKKSQLNRSTFGKARPRSLECERVTIAVKSNFTKNRPKSLETPKFEIDDEFFQTQLEQSRNKLNSNQIYFLPSPYTENDFSERIEQIKEEEEEDMSRGRHIYETAFDSKVSKSDDDLDIDEVTHRSLLNLKRPNSACGFVSSKLSFRTKLVKSKSANLQKFTSLKPKYLASVESLTESLNEVSIKHSPSPDKTFTNITNLPNLSCSKNLTPPSTEPLPPKFSNMNIAMTPKSLKYKLDKPKKPKNSFLHATISKIRAKYSSSDSMTSSSNSLESINSSSSNNSRSNSISSHSSDGASTFNIPIHPVRHTKLNILSPISDKSFMEQSSEHDGHKTTTAVIIEDKKPSPDTSNNKCKKRVLQNKNLPNQIENHQGSDSGISVESKNDLFKDFNHPFDQTKIGKKRESDTNNSQRRDSINSIDIQDLPFDMPKLRKKRQAPQLAFTLQANLPPSNVNIHVEDTTTYATNTQTHHSSHNQAIVQDSTSCNTSNTIKEPDIQPSSKTNPKDTTSLSSLELSILPFDMPKLRRKLQQESCLKMNLPPPVESAVKCASSDVPCNDRIGCPEDVAEDKAGSCYLEESSCVDKIEEKLPFDMPKLRRRMQQLSSQDGESPSTSQSAGPTRPLSLNMNAIGTVSSLRKQANCLSLNLVPAYVSGEPVDVDLPLERQGWYHGSVTRHEAENILRNSNEGSYLVRNSESNRPDYSLSLKSARGFMHMKIQRDPDTGKFILGQFSAPFDSVPEMIQHFAENRLPILGAEHMCLLHPMIEQLL
ncbi:hypothetical protein M8J76_012724 [Diaphorina citri]|nr:hypothetical protein M8J76_012724 [Diaphorina citri]